MFDTCEKFKAAGRKGGIISGAGRSLEVLAETHVCPMCAKRQDGTQFRYYTNGRITGSKNKCCRTCLNTRSKREINAHFSGDRRKTQDRTCLLCDWTGSHEAFRDATKHLRKCCQKCCDTYSPGKLAQLVRDKKHGKVFYRKGW